MTSNPRTRAAIRFSVIAGGFIGLLRTLPAYAAVRITLFAGLLASVLAPIGVLALIWILVRRRQHSLLSSAVQLWSALMIGWVLAGILTHPIAKEIAPDVTWGVIALGSGIGLLISPVTIAIAAIVIRLGRLVPGSGKPRPVLAATSQPGIDSPVA